MAAVEALAVVAEAAVAFELARAAREKFGGDALDDFVGAWRAYRGADRVAHALERHLALVGFMGAGKTTLGAQVADRLGRRFVDLDRELERSLHQTVPELFEQRGEAEFRVLEAEATLAALRNERPAVLALGGGAVETQSIRRALRECALTVLIDVDPQIAWTRAGGKRTAARARRVDLPRAVTSAATALRRGRRRRREGCRRHRARRRRRSRSTRACSRG